VARFGKKVAAVALLFITSWAVADAFQPFDPSHSAWTTWLRQFTKDDGATVDYRRARADQNAFRAYLASLSSISPRVYSGWPAPRKLAFLLNAYNAFAVRLVVDNYPLRSIRDLSSPLRSVWKKPFFQLFGESETLDGIEEGMLRKQFKDPRIHFAIGCYSRGGPALGAEAWREERIEAQLEAAAKRFFADSAKNRFEGDKLVVSPLLDWFEADFQGKYGSVGKFLARYFGPKAETSKIAFSDFDWSLNEAN